MGRKKVELNKIKKISKETRNKNISIILGTYPEEAESIIGENRGQLFVRIPRIITTKLGWKKGQKMKFKVYKKDNKNIFEIEVN